MGKLNPKQVENLSEPGTYEDGEGLRLTMKATGATRALLAVNQSPSLPPERII